MSSSIHLTRTGTILRPVQSRVLLRPFNLGNPKQVGAIIGRIMLLPEDEVGELLDEVTAEFSQRHQDIDKVFLARYEQARDLLFADWQISEKRRLLIGSY